MSVPRVVTFCLRVKFFPLAERSLRSGVQGSFNSKLPGNFLQIHLFHFLSFNLFFQLFFSFYILHYCYLLLVVSFSFFYFTLTSLVLTFVYKLLMTHYKWTLWYHCMININSCLLKIIQKYYLFIYKIYYHKIYKLCNFTAESVS